MIVKNVVKYISKKKNRSVGKKSPYSYSQINIVYAY